MSEKREGWNWKTHLLSLVLGVVLGRWSKATPSVTGVRTVDNKPTRDEEIEALLLVLGVFKELFDELGGSLSPQDTRGAIDRAWARAATQASEPAIEERTFLQKRVIPLIMQTMSSAVPSVPAVVLPRVYGIIDAFLPNVAGRLRARLSELSEDEYAKIAEEIRRIRHKWENERRPQPYSEVALRLERMVESLGHAA